MSIVDSLRGKELEDYVYEKYGIINATEDMGYWMIEDAWGNTSEEQYEIWDMIEWVEDKDLVINDGDIIAVYIAFGKVIELYNVDNDTYGHLKIKHNELWDDDRFALINEITDMYKKYKDVTFQMYLLYTEEQMMNYVRAIEKEDEEFEEYIKNKNKGEC